MSLTVKVDGGWTGTVSGRFYPEPRENKQSAELQERRHVQTLPPSLPKSSKPGSKEEARFAMQEEALTNLHRTQLAETRAAFMSFRADHPEFVDTESNAIQIKEYFLMKGVPFVQFNGETVPLATSQEQWEDAYSWKMSMGSIQYDPSVTDAQERLKAQKKSAERMTRKEPTEEELYELPWNEFEKQARGWHE